MPNIDKIIKIGTEIVIVIIGTIEFSSDKIGYPLPKAF